MNNSYIYKIIVAPAVFIIFGCDQRHDDYIGKDIRNIMQSVTDDGYMVVWPRVRMDIFEKCQSVEYVTLVPKKNPNYAIDIKIDEKCKIKSFKKRPRKGI